MSRLRSVLLLACLVMARAGAAEPAAAPGSADVTHIQAWLGVMDTEDALARPQADAGDTLVADLGALPFGAGAAQRLWGNGRLQFGMEGGGLATWKTDDWAFSSIDGALTVRVRGEFLSVGFFMGAVASVSAGANVRLYVAGGPALTWALLDGEAPDQHGDPATTVVVDAGDSASDLSFAPYVRAGIEWTLNNGMAFGLSARRANDEFDFGSNGTLEVDETLWLLTLGRQL